MEVLRRASLQEVPAPLAHPRPQAEREIRVIIAPHLHFLNATKARLEADSPHLRNKMAKLELRKAAQK